MKYQLLGNTGLKVSELCLGTMTFGKQADERTSFAIIDKAVNAGVNFIDTADVYPIPPDENTWGTTEEIIGKWLKGKRNQFVLATKCKQRVGTSINDEGLSRRHIMNSVEASLKRLQTDNFDLYQAHAPDPNTPLEETLRAFDDLLKQGKVRAIGCSNYPAWQIALALGISDKHGWSRWATVQPRYNILYREIEAELLPLCRNQNLGVLCYNPLAGGMLTGKYNSLGSQDAGARFTLGKTGDLYRERYWHQAHLAESNRLSEFFNKRGKSIITASIAWVLSQSGVTSAILGASRPDQLDLTLKAADFILEGFVDE
jgi:aryl-alcohol dehydrogenase-like predicted oxidoreductase